MASFLETNTRDSKGRFTSEGMITHGLSQTPLYKRCAKARQRGLYMGYGWGFESVAAMTLYLLDEWSDKIKRHPNEMLTIDRIDCTKGYKPGNVQVLTKSENSRKRMIERPNPAVYIRKPVRQITKGGVSVKEFISALHAEKDTGVANSSITNVANKKKHFHTAGGYRWEWVLSTTNKRVW